MRLIDGNELYDIEKLLDTDIIQSSKEASWLMSQVLHDIKSMPTIDLETLPIVQELRKQLEQVTKERNALLKELAGECGLCDNFKNCQKYPVYCINGNMWKWRGIQEKEDD